ncbi:MAG: tripartite tricarboxylate transporter substrate binding protein [Methylobacteriaceae bacterium]|nr:tripartite tricarboxylate transporter substrate binding protein [Methylobacteriaceae bacterium]
MLRRRFAALLAALAVSLPALAQTSGAGAGGWPARPVRVVVPFAAGGIADNLGRLVAQRLSQRLGQPFVVENIVGAGGNPGAATVARAAPDGYTLLMGTIGTHAINPALYRSMPYDHRRDFRPISLVATSPNVLAVPPSNPASSVAEFIASLRANPGKLKYASSGVGSSLHLTAELFKAVTGTEITHVPYRGSAPALTDLVGGRVDLIFDNISTTWPLVEAGSLKALAVTSRERAAIAPDVPTMAETLPGFEATSWHAMFAPAGLPDPIAETLSREVQAIMRQPDLVQILAKLGVTPVGSTPAELAEFVDRETAKWAKLVKDANIPVQ